MKKVFALALALVLALSLAACGAGEKVQIGIPADATNGARALLLLQDQGLITLKEGVGLEATEKDIAENPYNIEIVPMEAANLPASLPDLNLAVINGNYASGAGIADKVLLTEAAKTYGNVICVKEGNENNPAVQALVAVLMSQDVQDWISQNYNGVVMPMGAQELDIPEIAEPVTLKVGASPSPHAEILEYAKPILEQYNVNLEIVEFDDYVMPNTGVEDGSLDANYFQHQPYLDDFNAEQGTHLVSVATVHYEPMGLYPGKSASVDEVKQG
ncbi:MetQ/NlpA family ABC transporter substrate-binding protein [uncultured Ruthenibacterium sp.]|uniref:MetQ/NlpA family ABC transporter substrate-binding protein n=1 Tax=uncultured Ruthenibacterium sp. TaxID=1905347 RepID=UPI00349E7082